MKYYVAYQASGHITRSGNCSDDLLDWTVLPGETGLEVPTRMKPDDYWFDGSGVVAKSDLGVDFDQLTIDADGIDVAMLTGLPTGIVVVVDRTEYVVTDGVFELASTNPGTYLVRIQSPPYYLKTWKVIAL